MQIYHYARFTYFLVTWDKFLVTLGQLPRTHMFVVMTIASFENQHVFTLWSKQLPHVSMMLAKFASPWHLLLE